jgi:hypothetical protein
MRWPEDHRNALCSVLLTELWEILVSPVESLLPCRTQRRKPVQRAKSLKNYCSISNY